MSCWAASMRMILAWAGRPVADDDAIAAPTGHASSLRSGLNPNDGAPLKHWGFVMNAPQTYTEDGIQALLRGHGPLWIACDVRTPGYSRSVPHIRVIRGARDLQSPFALMINDPGPIGVGSQYDETSVKWFGRTNCSARKSSVTPARSMSLISPDRQTGHSFRPSRRHARLPGSKSRPPMRRSMSSASRASLRHGKVSLRHRVLRTGLSGSPVLV